MNKSLEAYDHGFNDGKYGFTYLNPYYSQDELNEWTRGFKDGMTDNYNPSNQ